MPVPAARLTSPDAGRHGRTLFLANCAVCHGERGDGNGVRRNAFNVRPRDFTDADWRRSTTPRHVYFAIREGVSGTAMPAWKSLDSRDVWDLVAYLLSIGTSREGGPDRTPNAEG